MHISDKMKNGIATFQEIFNKEWQYFVVEKHPQCSREDICLYRDSKGNKCAVGLLIKIKEYKSQWDRVSTSSREILIELKWDRKYEDFLDTLQMVHDHSPKEEFTEEIIVRLKRLAKDNNLEVPHAE